MNEQEKLFNELRVIGYKILESASFIQNDFDRLIQDKILKADDLLVYENEFVNSSLSLIEDYRTIINKISRFSTKKYKELIEENKWYLKKYENIPEYIIVKDMNGNLKKQVEIVKSNLDLYEGEVNITLRSYLIYYLMLLSQISLIIFSFYFIVTTLNIIFYVVTIVCSIWYLTMSILLIKTEFKYAYLEREIYLKRKEN